MCCSMCCSLRSSATLVLSYLLVAKNSSHYTVFRSRTISQTGEVGKHLFLVNHVRTNRTIFGTIYNWCTVFDLVHSMF